MWGVKSLLSCTSPVPVWYDPELHPKILEFCKHYGFTLADVEKGYRGHRYEGPGPTTYASLDAVA